MAEFFTEPYRYFADDVLEAFKTFKTEKALVYGYPNPETYHNVIYPVDNKGNERQDLFMEMRPKTITKNNRTIRYCKECYNYMPNIDNDFEKRQAHKRCHFAKSFELPIWRLKNLNGIIIEVGRR